MYALISHYLYFILANRIFNVRFARQSTISDQNIRTLIMYQRTPDFIICLSQILSTILYRFLSTENHPKPLPGAQRNSYHTRFSAHHTPENRV